MLTLFTLRSPDLSLQVNSLGAEITSLRNQDGVEHIWQAGPEWPRHTPLMFPIIGRTVEDVIIHDGREYPMTQHGFARDHDFDVTEKTDSILTLRLRDNSDTRRLYPFSFQLTTTIRVEGRRVHVRHDVSNTGTSDMPASLGWHPAFTWPNHEQAPATLTFECEEGPRIGRLDPQKVLLLQETSPSPIHDQELTLTEESFNEGALCFLHLNSRSVTFTAEIGPQLTLSFPEFQHLTVWKAPKADMLCLEPWYGTPSPADFRGELRNKPHQFHLNAGGHRSFSYSLTVG